MVCAGTDRVKGHLELGMDIPPMRQPTREEVNPR
jgi:hypothetical protein